MNQSCIIESAQIGRACTSQRKLVFCSGDSILNGQGQADASASGFFRLYCSAKLYS